mmetsp:Transcript_25709/g.76724  ORF Transcript_25709/g.76724 Transcript_25709/m.76724 type:complete len:226 (-) Transcript_25709:582-1259(-)
MLIELGEDAVGNCRGPHARVDHLFEEADACPDIVGLHAAVHQRVVHELVGLQAPRLDGFGHLQGLLEVPDVAVALQQRGEGDQVRLQRTLRRRHLSEQALGRGQFAALDAGVEDGVVGDGVVGHALLRHLTEELQRVRKVLLQAVALDQGGVEDGVLVLADLAHALEDLDRLLEVAALHASVDHAAVSDRVGLVALLLHVPPDLEHLLDVPGLAVRLDQDAQGHG